VSKGQNKTAVANGHGNALHYKRAKEATSPTGSAKNEPEPHLGWYDKPYKHTDHTIKRISQAVNRGIDFAYPYGNFLDAFYDAPQEDRPLMIEEPPDDMPKREDVPFLAAVAHRLANLYGLVPPEWVFMKKCYLPREKPWVSLVSASEETINHWINTGPEEFIGRNLIVPETTMSRW
jgi:hypothetical protein